MLDYQNSQRWNCPLSLGLLSVTNKIEQKKSSKLLKDERRRKLENTVSVLSVILNSFQIPPRSTGFHVQSYTRITFQIASGALCFVRILSLTFRFSEGLVKEDIPRVNYLFAFLNE
uniref:Uncharacterized protein n=1 Tax=Megaselia scalaris TaxID=36166 RepID=T1H3Z2_MEGSC